MFHVIEELPLKDQQELTRNLGVDPTKRTTRKVAFYNARAEYLDNRIIELETTTTSFVRPVSSCPMTARPALLRRPVHRTGCRRRCSSRLREHRHHLRVRLQENW